jgi:hypothetical protein
LALPFLFGFRFRHVVLGDEETTRKRFVAQPDKSRFEIATILRALGADLDLSSVSQSLDSRSRLGPA